MSKGWLLITTGTIMLMGWIVACTKASPPETLIEYHRSGGFIGLDDHLVIKENGEAILTRRRSERYEFTLDGDTLNRLQALFEEAGFSQFREEYRPSHPGADLFEYVVTYRGHTVRALDPAVPLSLRPILEALNQIIEGP